MKKRLISFLLTFSMAIAVLAPSQAKKVMAAESANVSQWSVPVLIYGDTYGIYPLSWYDNDLTKQISKDKFMVLYYGLRKKLVDTNSVKEVRTERPVISDSMTVLQVLEAFYTMLSNYDYPVDIGLGEGMDAVTYMTRIGAYTGQNGEQGLQDICSIEQAMVIASRIVTVLYDALGASSKGFFWEVKSGGNTVYLLGSVHLASTKQYPLSKKIWTAFFNSDALVVEANIYDNSDLLSMQEMMYYLDGSSLKDHVSEETYKTVVELASIFGLSEELVAIMKPWAVYLLISNYAVLSTSAGADANGQLGIDSNFLLNAMVYRKPIYAVEGLKKQAEILESFSDGLQEYLVNTSAQQLKAILSGEDTASGDKLNDQMETLFRSWQEGDVKTFAQLYSGNGMEEFEGVVDEEVMKYSEEYQTKFMVQRDDNMAAYIDNLLKTEGNNTYFVVLGSLHYISDNSVIDRLVKAGYTIEQIK